MNYGYRKEDHSLELKRNNWDPNCLRFLFHSTCYQSDHKLVEIISCQRMLTQVYFLWWESGGENESKRFCFQAICCQSASADSLLFVKYPFLFNSFNFQTQLISFYLFFNLILLIYLYFWQTLFIIPFWIIFFCATSSQSASADSL